MINWKQYGNDGMHKLTHLNDYNEAHSRKNGKIHTRVDR